MYSGEQAVQVFLVTNCLCSDINTHAITQFLRLCDSAVQIPWYTLAIKYL